MREFRDPARYDILFEDIEQIIVVTDFSSLQGVGADLKIDVLGFLASDRALEFFVGFGVHQ